MTRFLVIANGEPPSHLLLKELARKTDKVVAVDGGACVCMSCGLKPDLLVGDFDSISNQAKKWLEQTPQFFAHDQDKSDLEKTLEHLFTLDAKEIIVCGATGKRLDHTLVNMSLLCRYPKRVKYESDLEICYALPKSSQLSCTIGQTLSLIPATSPVKQVFTKGLKWDIHGRDLDKNFVSISNICRSTLVDISFEEGELIVCLEKRY